MCERKEKQEHKGASRIISPIAACVAILTGVVLLLYPALADYVNIRVNRAAISEYQEQVRQMDEEDYAALVRDVEAYNEEIFRRTPYLGELTAERREVYESLLNITGTGLIGYVEIPKINVYLAVYHGTSSDTLQSAIGHVESSSLPLPGESVHTILSGHSGLPSARLFTDVDQLKIGDTFTLHVLNETLTYEVIHMQKVLPDTLQNLRIEEGMELCTLMTCTPYSVNTHRLIVTGKRIETPVEEEPEPGAEKKKEKTPLVQGWDASQLIAPAIIFGVVIVANVTVLCLIRRRQKSERDKE